MDGWAHLHHITWHDVKRFWCAFAVIQVSYLFRVRIAIVGAYETSTWVMDPRKHVLNSVTKRTPLLYVCRVESLSTLTPRLSFSKTQRTLASIIDPIKKNHIIKQRIIEIKLERNNNNSRPNHGTSQRVSYSDRRIEGEWLIERGGAEGSSGKKKILGHFLGEFDGNISSRRKSTNWV